MHPKTIGIIAHTGKAGVGDLVNACRKHGKTPGFLAGDENWASDFRARGFRMIAYGVDTLLMQRALADGIRLLQGTLKK